MSCVEKVSAEGALINIGLCEKKSIARELNAPSNFWEATRKIKNTIGLVQLDAQSGIHEFNREITKSSWELS